MIKQLSALTELEEHNLERKQRGIEELTPLEFELLEALEVLLNETMYKDHPTQSQKAIDAIKQARNES